MSTTVTTTNGVQTLSPAPTGPGGALVLQDIAGLAQRTTTLEGMSVVAAQVNASGHLVLTLSAGTSLDAGGVVGPAGSTGVISAAGTAPLTLTYNAAGQSITGTIAPATATTPGVAPLSTLQAVTNAGAVTTNTITVGPITVPGFNNAITGWSASLSGSIYNWQTLASAYNAFIVDANVPVWYMGSGAAFAWSHNSNGYDVKDLGFRRASAGLMAVSDGSTGLGSLTAANITATGLTATGNATVSGSVNCSQVNIGTNGFSFNTYLDQGVLHANTLVLTAEGNAEVRAYYGSVYVHAYSNAPVVIGDGGSSMSGRVIDMALPTTFRSSLTTMGNALVGGDLTATGSVQCGGLSTTDVSFPSGQTFADDGYGGFTWTDSQGAEMYWNTGADGLSLSGGGMTTTGDISCQGQLQAENGITSFGDIEIIQGNCGMVLRSPGGTRWRITVNDTGVLTTMLA